MEKVKVTPYLDNGLMLFFEIGDCEFRVCTETWEIYTRTGEAAAMLDDESLVEYLHNQADCILSRVFSVIKTEFQNGQINLKETGHE
jgi:hypothetical protein